MERQEQKLFGRRKGRKLHKRKESLVKTLLPLVQLQEGAFGGLSSAFTVAARDQIAAFFVNEDADDAQVAGEQQAGGQTELAAPFEGMREFVLEIGFGSGDHLAAQALANPEIGFIGCEPFLNGVANLLDLIDEKKITNIRIFPDDARKVLDGVTAGAFARCYVLYPDPWPKARHAERRFIGTENMPRLARALKTGAELRMATDMPFLAAWMDTQAAAHPDFERVYKGFDAPSDWIRTRYEQKGLDAGRTPHYLRFVRRDKLR